MYTITGATGNIGKVIARNLLQRGEKVRVIGRNAERLQTFAEKGAEVAVGSQDDLEFLTNAFRGATAVYYMTPLSYAAEDFTAHQNELGEVAQKAIQATGVSHVVNLSSMGAHLGDGVGPVNGLYDVEQLLDETDANVVHLRPTFFMENFYQSIPSIKSEGIIANPLREDLAMPMIATRDIGNVAAKLLIAHDWQGTQERELLGPQNYTCPQVAQILGKAINREVKFVRIPPEQMRQGLLAAGISASLADLLLEMYEALNLEVMVPTEMRNPENSTPTTMEEFAQAFAQAYRQS
ncbi:MAG: NmrA family NAD(P)-binding protein [bacterium]